MQELDDNALLREYLERASEEAFAALVARHINKVYSVALRHTRNPDHAGEITQAVFVILAGKARHLGKRVILSGWLYQTARLTAVTFIRGEIRRARREQEAHMQSLLDEPEDEAWRQIAPLLDAAMAGLNETDRHAVVLRFFDGKSMREVGAALGANEEAAKKRVGRALEKLQKFFFKRGVASTTDTIAGTISANSVQAAPVALAKTVTAAALAKGAAVSASTLTLAKAVLIAMKTKTIVTTIAAAVLIIGAGAYLLNRARTHPAAVPIGVVPIKFPNNDYFANGDARFLVSVDPDTKRTTNSHPAGHIKCLVPATSSGSADFLASTQGGNRALRASRIAAYNVSHTSPLLGKRIRIRGWIKAGDVQTYAGATMLIKNDDGHIFADDDMTDRGLHGTTDWQQIESVTDVPNEPCVVYIAPSLEGTGEMWFDDFQLDVVPSNTPITDDRPWHFWSQNPNDYSKTIDYLNMHDGHSTVCLAYTAEGKAPPGSWMWWGQDIRTPECDKYRGHTVRMSGWVKTENVSVRVHPNLRPKGPNFKLLARDSQINSFALKGTLDWTRYSETCRIPKETQCLDTGFYFGGSGKVWIDMDSLKYEIIK